MLKGPDDFSVSLDPSQVDVTKVARLVGDLAMKQSR